ncbi:hypothetical protein NQD34_006308 [Periophthalmus magnuspinnatus]|uniref:zinc finger protein 239-like isoform X2 n=1 Tax=Periophthalmus magnuspinnatus TaxID=409849 RepID=UPI00145AEF82|nr:zinc finger protein 239-like isoform X2 [Periophthalmus magnuspinnatus]KAJ0001288.1 hypothetical protein NQD34_006308 [Periophthalmus magnuspinnatus]
MSAVFSFQNQLSSIMDALSKTAVLEISKLVEIESKMLKIEINRGRNEIASLTEKLQLMEKLLYMAQSNRQESSAVMVRGASDRGLVVQPDRTKPAINSSPNPEESPRETITSSTEDTNLQQKTEHSQSTQNPVTEQPELIVIKEEPSDVECGISDERSTGKPVVVDIQVSSDVAQCPRPVRLAANRQSPLFTENIIKVNNQTPQVGSESVWNLQLSSACTNLENEKSRNAVPPSNIPGRNVKVHNLRNSSTKRFSCLQCGKNFRCFSQLEIHQRSHTGEKPFRCTLCGKKYAQKGHLYTHQRTHTGEKPYGCPICGKGFIQKCTLDMHQRTHTGEKPFVCIKCGKGFTKNCNLKKHLAVHLDTSLHIYGNDSATTFSGSFINRTT